MGYRGADNPTLHLQDEQDLNTGSRCKRREGRQAAKGVRPDENGPCPCARSLGLRKLLKVPEPWKNLSKAGFGENAVAMACKVNHREEMGRMGRLTQQLIDEGSHRD